MASNAESGVADGKPQQVGISSITFTTQKQFAWVELFIDDGNTTQLKVESKLTSKIVFHLPQALTLVSEFSLRLPYRHSYSVHTKMVKIAIREILEAYKHGGEERQEWHRSCGRSCELVVGLEILSKGRTAESANPSPHNANKPASDGKGLRPMTDQILEVCPQYSFRILVIGKTGAGKSSLINKAFGVDTANISHKRPGKTQIEEEIRSESNPQFLLHDSLGFEHGEEEHLHAVKQFIQRRDQEKQLKEKLHAIWICLEIPIMGGRLLETGVESFLKLKTGGKLGNVPVIAVFTKYDLFLESVKMALHKQNPNSKTLDKDTTTYAQSKLIEECVNPFEKAVERKVPHITVSTSEGSEYEHTLQNLIQVTFDTVFDYLEDASVVTAIAQKVNSDVKIRAIVNVGKKQYWKGLASSLKFPTYTLERCLEVIHTDIVKVWDFKDPAKLMFSPEFRALMANGVDFKNEGGDSNKTLTVGLSVVSTLAGIISTLSGPAAPIVIPIAAGFVFSVWAHEVYVQSRTTLRRLMTYIVDLTLVTQSIFWIRGSTKHPITRRLIKFAFRAYITSNERGRLITEIDDYCKTAKMSHGGSDTTFEKILDLITSSSIDSEQMLKQDYIRDGLWDQGDEEWDTPDSPVTGK